MGFEKTGRTGLGDNAQPVPDEESWEDEGGSPLPTDDED